MASEKRWFIPKMTDENHIFHSLRLPDEEIFIGEPFRSLSSFIFM